MLHKLLSYFIQNIHYYFSTYFPACNNRLQKRETIHYVRGLRGLLEERFSLSRVKHLVDKT